MKTRLKLDPTRIGEYLMLAFPVLILGYDAVLKFVLHLPTISSDVWASGLPTRIAVSAYLVISAIALGLHFVFLFFDGPTAAELATEQAKQAEQARQAAQLDGLDAKLDGLDAKLERLVTYRRNYLPDRPSGATPRIFTLTPNISGAGSPIQVSEATTGRLPTWGGYIAGQGLPPRPPELPNSRLGFNILSLEHLLYRRRVRLYCKAQGLAPIPGRFRVLLGRIRRLISSRR